MKFKNLFEYDLKQTIGIESDFEKTSYEIQTV